MKIVMIHGQNHAGSTCMVARELAHIVPEQAASVGSQPVLSFMGIGDNALCFFSNRNDPPRGNVACLRFAGDSFAGVPLVLENSGYR